MTPAGGVAGAGGGTWGRVSVWLWWALVVLALAAMTWEAFPFSDDDADHNARDWEFFYPAAQALLDGTDLYESGERKGYIYPPLLAFLLTPLVPLGFSGSAQVWLVLSVAALLGALVLAVRDVSGRLGPAWRPARLGAAVFVALLMSANFTRRELEHTQTDWITILGFVLGLIWIDRRPLLAGAVLGVAANVKYHTLIVVPYLLLRRKYKAAGATLASSVLAALLPAVMIGWERNLDYLARAFGGLAQFVGINVPRRANVWELEHLDSVSVTSALARGSGALGGGMGLTGILLAIAAAACIGLAWWMYRANGFAFWARTQAGEETTGQAAAPAVEGPGPLVFAAEWMGLIVATLAFSPQTLKRHMFVMVPVYAMTAVILLARPQRLAGEAADPPFGRWKTVLFFGMIASLLAVFLPPRTQASEAASNAWRSVGGPSLGLLVLFFALLWTALVWAREARRPTQP